MSIYFKSKSVSTKQTPATIPQISQQGKMPAHEKIGGIYTAILSALTDPSASQNHANALFKDLGVDSNDVEATSEMSHLLVQLNDGTLQVSPLVSGVFLLKKKDPTSPTGEFKEFAIFKIGRKRAAMESSARFLANLLGLNKHTISGMYCTMLNLPVYELVDEEDTTEDLWNGNQKIYERNKPVQTSPVGVNQKDPFSKNLQFDFELDEEANDPNSNPSDFTRSVEGEASLDQANSKSSDFTRSGENAASLDQANSKSSDFTRTAEGEASLSRANSRSPDFTGSPVFGASLSRTNSGNISWDSCNEFLPASTHTSAEKTAFTTACAVVGIVQPYLFEREEADVYEFTLMTIVALAIGLRDGKNDGFKGSMLFDIEDNFPVRNEPIFNLQGHMSSSCTIDLPYLDNDRRTTTELKPEQVKELYNLVSKWKILDIIKKLGKLEIIHEDRLAEQMRVNAQGKDEGNFEVSIIESEPHAINGKLNTLCSNNPKRRILLQEQLEATATRLHRIHDFISSCAITGQPFTPEDLVNAVDIAGKIYKERMLEQSGTLGLSAQNTLTNSGPNHISGRFSPDKINLKTPITERDLPKIRQALRGTDSSEDNGIPTKSSRKKSESIEIRRDFSDFDDENDLLGSSFSPTNPNNYSFLQSSGNPEIFANSPNTGLAGLMEFSSSPITFLPYEDAALGAFAFSTCSQSGSENEDERGYSDDLSDC